MNIEKIRPWSYLDDAAAFLSLRLSVEVVVVDVLQMVLDGKFAISLEIVNPTPMRLGEKISGNSESETTSPHLNTIWKDNRATKLVGQDLHQPLSSDLLFRFSNNISDQTGIFEIQMVGPSRQLIELERQKVMKGVDVTIPMLPVILKATDGRFFALYCLYKPSRYTSDPKTFALDQILVQEKLELIAEAEDCQSIIDKAVLDYCSAFEDQYMIEMGLPIDSQLVIKTSDLAGFVVQLEPSENAAEDQASMQDLANDIAAELYLSKGRKPTRRQVANGLYDRQLFLKANGDPIASETIERRIKVTW
jgi:hypothetical protein